TGLRRGTFIIYEPRFVTFQQFSAASVTHVAFVIRHEHVEHLSRADAVEQFHPKGLLPFFTELRRQSLSGRYAETQTRSIQRRDAPMMFEQHSIDDRNTEKDCRTIFTEDATNYFGCGLLATKDRCKAVQ